MFEYNPKSEIGYIRQSPIVIRQISVICYLISVICHLISVFSLNPEPLFLKPEPLFLKPETRHLKPFVYIGNATSDNPAVSSNPCIRFIFCTA